MNIYAFESIGFSGELVKVEVDLRRGIPSTDIVGLPDGAVKEARERIKASIRNSGFEFPLERVLINLAPAGVKKGGAAFDLSMALAILLASNQLPDIDISLVALGELELSGQLRPVTGVLAAVAAGLAAAVKTCIVPPGNIEEARTLLPEVFALNNLSELPALFSALQDPSNKYKAYHTSPKKPQENLGFDLCMSDIKGQADVKRGMEIAAAGAHHVLLFGPPGAGKTMAARRLSGILPDLDRADSITLTTIHSLAGILPHGSGLLQKAPFRAPHHGASAEGIVGGGRARKPGEISLAHAGVLFLDEAAEFRADVLQALREPLESGSISIARADKTVLYPSRFTLVMACNPCPCGNLGRKAAVCLCSADEIRRYWKRLGGPLLDRIDIRLPVKTASPQELASSGGETSAIIKERVTEARAIQAFRYKSLKFKVNGFLEPGHIEKFCGLNHSTRTLFVEKAEHHSLSSRASHSILRLARTIADLALSENLREEHVEEAFNLRKYADSDMFWVIP